MHARWLLVVLTALASCRPVRVAHEQTERAANGLVVALAEAGVEATKIRSRESRDVRFDVAVSATDAMVALQVLEARNLPREPALSSRDLVDSGAMVLTPAQERLQQVVAFEGDLANALAALPGVIDVGVALSLPEAAVGLGRPHASSAAVFLVVRADSPPVAEEHVRAFVQAKLSGDASAPVAVWIVERPGSLFVRSAPAPNQALEAAAPHRWRTIAMLIGLGLLGAGGVCLAAGLRLRRRRHASMNDLVTA